ncbi:hypothetical protein sscle_12g088250 [Sclerotinia sclerotiorum 1980 UF-70]|uniref:Uncharacterized protein n=1 Tax=Sclerotinia sclerotiorum (strain ATCC 18683 / 1980 / Ss-1) TaxID=665079 RepID=A0A1D9QGJ7_SCLS1|nr:hypothetical protein sscle_12g088250 [Sclerotinia sclerotiorum 1980 UF-70]
MSERNNKKLPPTEAPVPPFGKPGNQGKSALRHENFLCNIADAIVPSGLFRDHNKHRRDTAYKSGDFKKAEVDVKDEEDDWVNLTDKTTKSGPIQITPRASNSPERSRVMTKPQPTSPGFEQARLSARSFENASVAWAITSDTDLTPAVVGQPDNSKFVLRRYDIRDPTKIEKKRIELHIDEFDWNNKEHVGRLNKARRQWEINTLESNPQTSGKSRVTVDGRDSPFDISAGSWSLGEEEEEEEDDLRLN